MVTKNLMATVREMLGETIRHHPIASAAAIFAVDLAIAAGGGIAATRLLPATSSQATGDPGAADFLALIVVTVTTALLVTLLGWWRKVGFNRPAAWRNLPLMLLPALLVLLPLLGGIRAIEPGVVVFLVVGYTLTGFREETLYRGVLLRVLQPLGVWPAVLGSSLLFGLAHSTNLLMRLSGNPGMVAFQILGTFVIGIGFAALRLRTNTLWTVIGMHALLDLFLALGQLPRALINPIQGTILLVYAIFLIRSYLQRNKQELPGTAAPVAQEA